MHEHHINFLEELENYGYILEEKKFGLNKDDLKEKLMNENQSSYSHEQLEKSKEEKLEVLSPEIKLKSDDCDNPLDANNDNQDRKNSYKQSNRDFHENEIL